MSWRGWWKRLQWRGMWWWKNEEDNDDGSDNDEDVEVQFGLITVTQICLANLFEYVCEEPTPKLLRRLRSKLEELIQYVMEYDECTMYDEPEYYRFLKEYIDPLCSDVRTYLQNHNIDPPPPYERRVRN